MLRRIAGKLLKPIGPHPEPEFEGIFTLNYYPTKKEVDLELLQIGGPSIMKTVKNVFGISTQETGVVVEIGHPGAGGVQIIPAIEFSSFDGYMDRGDGIFKFWEPRIPGINI